MICLEEIIILNLDVLLATMQNFMIENRKNSSQFPQVGVKLWTLKKKEWTEHALPLCLEILEIIFCSTKVTN